MTAVSYDRAMQVAFGLAGVVLGAVIGLASGVLLQMRAEARRSFAAAHLVAAELRFNAGEVAHYFVERKLAAEGSKAMISMPVRVRVAAWDANAIDVMPLADRELRDLLLRLYAYLDRFEREPMLLRPNIDEHMRDAAAQLERLAQPSPFQRRVLRISGDADDRADGRDTPSTA
jgi:hypothetical protein